MPKLIPFDEFLSRSRAVHGDRYDYTQAAEVWRGIAHKIPITCAIHGVFNQYPQKHLAGTDCPTCSRQARSHDPEEIAARIHTRYPNYVLDRVSYRRTDIPAIWSCTIHHLTFRACFFPLLQGTARGCPACHETVYRQRTVAKRSDPNAAANLARVSAVLGAAFAETYQRWLAGDTLAMIGQAHGVTGERIRQRLLRVRVLVQERPGTD
ncbi:hypothetical protein [uncultured Thiodictyon sp.]|uniref:hypothetical protein n=1 Tax=uncultured Thiodictyon sp. TaxID=1846217 RepID=UPI0025F60C77|nr:hypothetical protein [uncultured Thiodictyon sp.]